MKSHRRTVAVLALCLGCASATTGREQPQAEWAPPGTSLFTSQELARYAQRGSVADLLEHASSAILGPDDRFWYRSTVRHLSIARFSRRFPLRQSLMSASFTPRVRQAHHPRFSPMVASCLQTFCTSVRESSAVRLPAGTSHLASPHQPIVSSLLIVCQRDRRSSAAVPS